MWSVTPPAIDSGATFDLCADRIKSPVLRTKMHSIRPDVVNLSNAYDMHGRLGQLHLMKAHKSGIKGIAGSDLIKNYTVRMVGKKMPARAVYDALKVLPRNDRCPYCRYGTIETLDHSLPKELYPGISVHPNNLVGSCGRCNKKKHNTVPTGPGDSAIHPYFDDVDHKIWLIAEIIKTTPAAALFRVCDAPGFAPDLDARVRHQFDELKLDHLYSNIASEEIAGIEEELEEIFQAGGPSDVAAHLTRKSRSRRKTVRNSWQAALYDAMATSKWYCLGGFHTK